MDHVGEYDFQFPKIAKKKGFRRPLFHFPTLLLRFLKYHDAYNRHIKIDGSFCFFM
jgi:hypothetical protein